jgi:predicted ATPase
MTGNQAVADRTVSFLEDITTKRGFRQHIRMAHLLQGMLSIARGEFQAGVALLSPELEANKAEDRKSIYPCAFGPLAEGLAELGQLTNALATIDEGLAISDDTGERWDVPELLRIKGDVLLRRKEEAAAEGCFNRAAELAREQGARFWELRIALSLARLRVRQDLRQEARELLAPVYDRFTEGFATADMRAARAMLDRLPFA